MLLPIAFAYDGVGRLRRWLTSPVKVEVPVICIGNAVAGGAGKTPVALAVAEILKAQGHRPHFLSRGYGGTPQRKPVLVSGQSALEVGDEPLLLARCAPCWVCPNRVAAAQAAIAAGATVLVMDDGLQNPSLHKDISLLVVDAVAGFGNGRIIPAGALREPLSALLPRVDAVVSIGGIVTLPALRCFNATLSPLIPLTELPSPAVAFAGIGRPEKFFTMLRDGGVTLVEAIVFPDHYRYTHADIAALRAHGLPLLTTAKDAVKLPQEFLQEVTIVEVALQYEQQEAFESWLKERLSHA